MFVLKIAVGICCVITCVKIAGRRAQNLKKEYDFWNSVCISCDFLISNFSYKKEEINKVLNVDYPSLEYAMLVASFIKNENFNFPPFVNNEEKIRLKSMFLELGKADAKTQKNAILSYKNDFILIRDLAKSNYDKNFNLILKVGFMFGVMLFVLVI